MIGSIILGLALGIFKFNFAENILKITMTDSHTDTLDWILYSLLCTAFSFCMYDIGSLADISAVLNGELKITADMALRNIFVGIVSYVSGYAARPYLPYFRTKS